MEVEVCPRAASTAAEMEGASWEMTLDTTSPSLEDCALFPPKVLRLWKLLPVEEEEEEEENLDWLFCPLGIIKRVTKCDHLL